MLSARLRVGVGVFVLALFCCASATGAEVARVLPFANAGGYATTLVVVNPTDEAIPFVAEARVYPPLVVELAPHSVTRSEGWPHAGVNVASVTVDDRLEVYAEFRTPTATFFRQGPLEALTVADFYDLPAADSTFDANLFVAVAPGVAGDVAVGASRYSVDDTVGILIPAAGEHVRLETGGAQVVYPPLPDVPAFYAFAIVTHHATGAINAIAARAVR